MSQENVELVREIYAAVARRDAATAFDYYAEAIIWDASKSSRALVLDSSVYHGHEGVRQFWRELVSVFGEVDLDAEELIDAGGQVVAVVRERQIGRTSGAPVEASHAAIWTLVDGRVIQMQMFDDRGQALKAVGLEE
jgi:ketosteroid isomerase-like protein